MCPYIVLINVSPRSSAYLDFYSTSLQCSQCSIITRINQCWSIQLIPVKPWVEHHLNTHNLSLKHINFIATRSSFHRQQFQSEFQRRIRRDLPSLTQPRNHLTINQSPSYEYGRKPEANTPGILLGRSLLLQGFAILESHPLPSQGIPCPNQ